MKKIIIAGVIVVVLAGGAGAYVVLHRKNAKKSTATTTTQDTKAAVPKVTKVADPTLCSSVDKTVIKSALGSVASNLAGPNDTGSVTVNDTSKAQTCIYPFAEGGTITDSFYIDLTTYTSKASLDESTQGTGTSGQAVSGLGDSASYTVTSALATKTKEFALTIKKDTKVYLFAISQPTASVTFTDATAKSALVTIATAAKL